MYLKDNIKLIHGDCLTKMLDIEPNSVDMVLCDLPYGVLNKSNKAVAWDKLIDFEPLWKLYKRVCKKDAAIVLFAQGMFTAKLLVSNPACWKYNLVWDKMRKTGFLNAKKQPLRQHEDICIFSFGKIDYTPQMIPCSLHNRNHPRGNNYKNTNNCYGNFGKTTSIIPNNKYPSSIISIPKLISKDGSLHPCQKPVKLLEELIKTYSKENNIILDNTAGSMSTAIAAINTNRKCICIEKDNDYFQLGKERVEKCIEEQNNNLFSNQ